MSEIGKVIVGELFGTFIMILLGNSISANLLLKGSRGNDGGWIVACVGWGFAVTTAALLSGISGAHLNPAVTIGLMVAGMKSAFVGGNFGYAPIYIVCQLIGAMLGALVCWLAFFKEFQTTTEKDKILGTFATSPVNRSYLWNTVTELIATFVLIMVIGGTVYIKNLTNPTLLGGYGPLISPIIVGIGVMVIGLSIGGPTAYAINPARDLGPRIIHALLPIKNKGGSDWSYAPVPIVGPILGAIIAGAIIQVLGLLG